MKLTNLNLFKWVFDKEGEMKEGTMGQIMQFINREEFRKWLSVHCLSSDGIWLLFGKAGGPETITASDALEDALCFGWIDGQMQSIDAKIDAGRAKRFSWMVERLNKNLKPM